jgi:hypothetical protein
MLGMVGRWPKRGSRSRRGQLRLIAIAVGEYGGEAASVSRGGKALRGFLVGRLLDTFDKEKASSAAPGGRLLNERKIPARPLDNP